MVAILGSAFVRQWARMITAMAVLLTVSTTSLARTASSSSQPRTTEPSCSARVESDELICSPGIHPYICLECAEALAACDNACYTDSSCHCECSVQFCKCNKACKGQSGGGCDMACQ
jgi:hypothetical protein